MDETESATNPPVSPAWHHDPGATERDVLARGLRRRAWTLVAILAALLGTLLGVASSFRLRPFPAFLPIVVEGAEGSAGKPLAFAAADLNALARRGLFGRSIGVPAPLRPNETILKRLDRLSEVSPLESLVVLVTAPARVGPDGEVEVLGPGSGGYGPTHSTSLRQILAKIAACPARNRLVLLDLMRPMADPIRGILDDDIAARIGPATDAAFRENRELYVLSACAPGQNSWVSEERGRSVFGLAAEEGLQGLADSEDGNGDGLVTVRELAQYVTRRTRAWVRHNRGAEQTPLLLEKGGTSGGPADFALAPRDRVRPSAGLEIAAPDARTYPDWLKAAWRGRDGLVANGDGRKEPRALRLLNAALLAAERHWRAGLDAAQIQKRLEVESTTLLPQFARVKSERSILAAHSLALEQRQGRLPDPAVRTSVGELLFKRTQSSIGLKPDEAVAAEAKLVTNFEAATKDKLDFDVASAVFAAAADTLVPEPRTIRFLGSLVETRPAASSWVEIGTLRRLADRADAVIQGKLPAQAWKPAMVRKILNVVREGERAHARVGSPGWTERWLDAAAEARHLGEVAFDAFGYVPHDRAEGYIDRAASRYSALLLTQDRFQDAASVRDDALDLLSDFLPYLDHAPELFGFWSQSIVAARALDIAIAVSPPELKDPAGLDLEPDGRTPRLEVLRAANDRIDTLAAGLRSPLDRLRAPFQEQSVGNLLAHAREPTADGLTWRSIVALLETPVLTADQRATTWTAAHELALALDASTPSDVPPASLVPKDDTADRPHGPGRIPVRRATEALSLLTLAGLSAEEAGEIDNEIRRHQQGSPKAPPAAPSVATVWPGIGAKLHQAWTNLIDAESDRGDLAARCRLARALPAAIRATSLDPGFDDPLAESRSRTGDDLRRWLADWFGYVGIDQGIEFFLFAAEEYRQAIETPTLRPAASWAGAVQTVELGEDQSVATIDLTLNFQAGSTRTADGGPLGPPGALSPLMASVIRPVREGLGASLEPRRDLDGDGPLATVAAGPGPGQYVIEPMKEGSIPLRLRLTRVPGSESAWSSDVQARPAGILVEAAIGGRVFSLKVPVVLHSQADAFRILLGDELEDQAGERKVLKLRPLPERQRIPLRLKNPTTAARDVIVELWMGRDASGPVAVSPRITLAGLATVPVALAKVASADGSGAVGQAAASTAGSNGGDAPRSATEGGGPVPLAELEGPLAFRVLDARKPELVLGHRVVPVEVANPADYVRIVDASLTPTRLAAKEANRLSVLLRSSLAASKPDASASLVLREERIPGFLGVEKGVLRGKLHGGRGLRLTAEGINLDASAAGDGVIELTVDGVERALLLKASFVENRDVSLPLMDDRVALRLRSPGMARTGAPAPVVLEADNAPEGSVLELTLGRAISGRFEPIETWRFQGTRRARIGVDPTPVGGGLRFEASLADWAQSLDTGGLRGRFALRALLRRGDGLILKEVEREILLDDRRPRWIEFVGIPRKARRGRTLEVKATGDSPPSGIVAAQFFVGTPDSDGKMPAGVAPVRGTRQPGEVEIWKAELKLPKDQGASEAAITVRFISGVGLDAIHTASIELADTDPIAPGVLHGVVRAGPLAQPDLPVGLFDAEGKNLREARSSGDGTFQFDDLIPGVYFVTSARSAEDTRGQAKVEVKAGETAEVTISLFR